MMTFCPHCLKFLIGFFICVREALLFFYFLLHFLMLTDRIVSFDFCKHLSCFSLPVFSITCCNTGILEEVLNRLRFDSPIGATILPSDKNRKPATHFVSEDRVLSDARVRKGSYLLPCCNADWKAFSEFVLQ